MLLAEELALVAARPGKGRHALGAREHLNGCLAGLLLAELVLDGAAQVDEAKRAIATTGTPSSPILHAAAHVVDVDGPGIKAVLSAMDRALRKDLGSGTWDSVASEPALEGRDEVIGRLQAAAAGDGAIDARTAAVLFMLRPAGLLRVVVSGDRAQRRHARTRVDTCLDGTRLLPIGATVRKVLADADAAVVVAGSVAATG